MGNDQSKQGALADVTMLAARLHELRALAQETDTLLAAAMATAVGEGLSKAIVAEAAGVSRGRVSQIVTATPQRLTAVQRARATTIDQWVNDALRDHHATFTGRMTYPPYSARRTALGVPSATS